MNSAPAPMAATPVDTAPMATGIDPPGGLFGRRRYAAILAVSLGTMVTSLDAGSASIALPTIARDLGIAPSAAVLVVTIFQLVMIMTVLPLSAVGERIGHRRLYQYGQILFVTAALLCFVARSLPLLVLMRGIQAIGGAAVLSVSAALVRAIYPRARLGSGLAFNTIVAASSSSLAPTIGGLILSLASWRWLFALTIPLGLISIVAGRRALPDPVRRQLPYDKPAAVMCAAMFGLIVIGLQGAAQGIGPGIAAALLAAAVAIGIVFVRRETRSAEPILPVDLLGRRDIALASAASLIGYIATMSFMLALPFRLQQAYGYSPAEAGVILAPWPLVMLFVAPASGALSDRVAACWLGLAGMVIAVGGFLLMAALPPAPHHFDIAWRIGFTGLGFGLFFSPMARHVIAAAPAGRAAAAGALSQSTRMLGQVLGSTTAAAVLASGIGAGGAASFIDAGCAAVAGACCLGLGLPRRRDARAATA